MADPLPHNVLAWVAFGDLELGYIQQYWSYKVPKVWGGGGSRGE